MRPLACKGPGAPRFAAASRNKRSPTGSYPANLGDYFKWSRCAANRPNQATFPPDPYLARIGTMSGLMIALRSIGHILLSVGVCPQAFQPSAGHRLATGGRSPNGIRGDHAT